MNSKPTTAEDPTTTVEATTTAKPTTTEVPTTTVEATTTAKPTTTEVPTTTVEPTATVEPTTTEEHASRLRSVGHEGLYLSLVEYPFSLRSDGPHLIEDEEMAEEKWRKK
jgi:hypothetical protein